MVLLARFGRSIGMIPKAVQALEGNLKGANSNDKSTKTTILEAPDLQGPILSKRKYRLASLIPIKNRKEFRSTIYKSRV